MRCLVGIYEPMVAMLANKLTIHVLALIQIINVRNLLRLKKQECP